MPGWGSAGAGARRCAFEQFEAQALESILEKVKRGESDCLDYIFCEMASSIFSFAKPRTVST